MRSKFTPIYISFSLFIVVFLHMANSTGLESSRAGALRTNGSNELTCQGCHGSSSPSPVSGNISFQGLPTSSIMAGQVYTFSINLQRPTELTGTNRRGGFQLVATDGTSADLVGSFQPVSGENTRINGSGRLVQSSPQVFGSAETISWDVQWTAPSDNLPSDIVFYTAGNAANGDGSNGSGDYGYNTSQSVPTGAALAVDFLNFTTQNTTTGIRLNWSVSNENQTDFYIIERSTNGKEFSQIATQTVATSTNQYQFIDTDLVKNQTYYYRIKEVATDGKNTFSTIETATYRTLAAQVIAYPNPATTDAAVQVKLPTNFAGTVQLVNVQGQVVYTQKIATQLAELALPTTNVAAGVYQLILQDGSEVYQQKLVIR